MPLDRLGIFVLDATGQVFALLRNLDLGVPLWRGMSAVDLDRSTVALAVIAAYGHPDWNIVRAVSADTPTVVFALEQSAEDAATTASVTGAIGYVDATLPREAMQRAIKGAMRGEHAFSRRVIADLMNSVRRARAATQLPLTPREREVIVLIAKGAADKEIARSLGIKTATAQKHVSNLLRRLKVPNRAAAVAAMSLILSSQAQ